MKDKQKEIYEKLLIASNAIDEKNKNGLANNIIIQSKYIQLIMKKYECDYNAAIELIRSNLNPRTDT